MEEFDVLIVGAGISGIGAAYHLQTNCPAKSYAILEARPALGGTWDLFRYPGIRSDSDMYTLGFSFRPWTNPKAIADGPAILDYLHETVREYGIDEHIRYNTKVDHASWSTRDNKWTVRTTVNGERVEIRCRFLLMCAGYYRYEAGYTPDFPGLDRFEGRVVHPQLWTEDIDYADKRVIVIGSGATAVTLVPELAKKAAHVTMLQRSPTYIASAPAKDRVANWLRRRFPAMTAYRAARWKNILFAMATYNYARRFPERTKRWFRKHTRELLGEDVDLTHFTPSYEPWDQRVCLVPDADLFDAIKSESVRVVTDHVEAFTETGIQLRGGEHLDAELVVTATGLQLQFLGGMELDLDGEPLRPADMMMYRGMMFSGVPNLAMCIGYTNASWTLKVDLTCEYVCRLLNHMDRHGHAACVPRRDPGVGEQPLIDFNSGYVLRAIEHLPKQGTKRPWKLYQNYVLDMLTLRHGRVADPAIEFS